MRVLIVDNDPAVAEQLPGLLRREGHQVHLRSCRADLVETVQTASIDLVILEPELLSFAQVLDLCHRLRRRSAVLLLVVSHRSGTAERVRLLEAGADDYVPKPFDQDELLARVHALFRRHPLSLFGQGLGQVPVTEDLSLDLAGRRLVGNGREVTLTEHEFRLLAYLVRHEGIVLSRAALLQAVWGLGYEGATREVDVYIRYLRLKVEPDPAKHRYLLTAWGTGYQYRGPAPASK